MIQPWPLLRSEPLGDFRVFKLRRDWRRSPRTGREHDFFVMNAPDWVNVIALTTGGQVVLVEQFRHGTASVDLEVPGGVMDLEDDSPLTTAVRELREETGYVGTRVTAIGSIAPNPALQANTCHTILIEGCEKTAEHDFDPGEDILTRLEPAAELSRLVATGRIRHALVAVAIQHYEHWLRGLKDGVVRELRA
ncbi:MAG: NUDIX hydrolase [Verrucomicrobiales bacterium]|nr:NUDIX hydrolase [Verrucomicrobiales bacterium]